MNMIKEISECRICKNKHLTTIIDLGKQNLSGVFPKTRKEDVPVAPLELVKCNQCGLVQLKHTFQLDKMYGDNYGYRSGLNKYMVDHLHNITADIIKKYSPRSKDLIIDIGSNDSTLLRSYSENNSSDLTLVGIDPTGKKFKEYYPEYVQLIPDFFSSKLVKEKFGNKKAKVVTSISMFYDLEDPTGFMRQVHEILDNDGVWVMEQSYMPTMIAMTSYDTICHEHLEYYCLKQIKWMADIVGLKILDITLNDINGGSFCVTLARKESSLKENKALVEKFLSEEKKFDTLEPFIEFKKKTEEHKKKIIEFLKQAKSEGKVVIGYGASTKGNIILHYCGITEELLPFIAEVNKDKFGSFTPGTLIPIISEEDAKKKHPDYLFVLPWHFKSFIVKKETGYLKSGGKIVFPLPKIEIVNA